MCEVAVVASFKFSSRKKDGCASCMWDVLAKFAWADSRDSMQTFNKPLTTKPTQRNEYRLKQDLIYAKVHWI